MKLKNFITESTGIPLVDVVKSIHKDCQPFLKEFIVPMGEKVDFLYSGRLDSGKPFNKETMRTNRPSLDTNDMIHDDLNKAFQKKFGYPARASSMFVTGSMYMALEYGKIYAVFPIGNYKYLWSHEIDDLYNYFNKIVNISKRLKLLVNPMIAYYEAKLMMKYRMDRDTVTDSDIKHQAEAQYDAYIEDTVGKYTNKGLVNAYKSGNEIMLHCNEYYLVAMGNGNPTHLKQWYQQFGNEMPPDDKIHDDFKEMVIV
jgi:hypothetical protein